MARKKEMFEDQVEVSDNSDSTEIEIKNDGKINKVEDNISPRFTIEQLVNSNRYKKYGYLIEAKLNKNETYTIGEVDKLLKQFV